MLATRAGTCEEDLPLGVDDRLAEGWQAVRDVIGRVWPYVLAGIAVGAAIHGYVALVVDGVVQFAGRVPTVGALKALLSGAAAAQAQS